MRVLLALALTAALQQAPRDGVPVTAPAAGTGTIKGRVVAAGTGTPIGRAIVMIAGPGGPRSVYTDGAGRYQARNLPAGGYSVRAEPNTFQAQYLASLPMPPLPDGSPRRVPLADGQTVEWPDIALPRAGAIAGRVVDDNGQPVSGVYLAPLRPGERPGPGPNFSSQSSDEFGRYRIFRLAPGEYELVIRPSGLVDDPVSGVPQGFVETYYPGTFARDQARRIRVRGGEETAAGDFQLTYARMLRVRGTVQDSRGVAAPQSTMVSIGRESGSEGTSLNPTGGFSFRPRAPGAYRVTARLLSENREATLEYAAISLTLTDTDVDDLVIAMKPTATFSGRVVFEGAGAPAVKTGALAIRVDRRDRAFLSDLFSPPASVSEDLTFTVRSLAGEALLRPSARQLDGIWSLKAVLLGNDDITDVPREFRSEDSGRVQVVLTNRWSELSGVVSGDDGKPAAGRTVVVFGEDTAAWFPESSRLRGARAGRDGRYVVPGLRPGRYYVVALPSSVPWDFQQANKSVLEQFTREATLVTIGEDDRRQVDLRVATGSGG